MAPNKKCGVSFFSVGWNQSPLNHPVVPGNMGFAITVIITFRSDGDYDPRCCEYEQWVITRYHLEYPDGRHRTGPKELETLHKDGYSRLDDQDGNPSYDDPEFLVSDNPGLTRLHLDFPVHVDFYEFTAEQLVKSRGVGWIDAQGNRHCCADQGIVARRGPHTAGFSGDFPNVTFWGVPKSLRQ